MKFFKLFNLKDMFGQLNYKGLDINAVVPGSPVYSQDLSFCILATTQEVLPNHTDLVEISENEYIVARKQIEDEHNQTVETLENRVKALEEEKATLEGAVMELTVALAAISGGAN